MKGQEKSREVSPTAHGLQAEKYAVVSTGWQVDAPQVRKALDSNELKTMGEYTKKLKGGNSTKLART